MLGISYVPGIGYIAGSQIDRNPCPHEADIPESGRKVIYVIISKILYMSGRAKSYGKT